MIADEVGLYRELHEVQYNAQQAASSQPSASELQLERRLDTV